MRRRAIILWRLVLTSCHQGQGAPIVDKCNGKTQEGRYWQGYAIHLTPWRKNSYGDRQIGLALCVGLLRKGRPTW